MLALPIQALGFAREEQEGRTFKGEKTKGAERGREEKRPEGFTCAICRKPNKWYGVFQTVHD